jgi:NAD(P)-dependent dehydrogenase (short-subunit alcohol dehydrogenase family)
MQPCGSASTQYRAMSAFLAHTQVLAPLNLLPVPWLEPEDISNALLWLVSDDARYVTGVALPVDAGAAIK